MRLKQPLSGDRYGGNRNIRAPFVGAIDKNDFRVFLRYGQTISQAKAQETFQDESDVKSGLYTAFVDHCVDKLLQLQGDVIPFPIQEEFQTLEGRDSSGQMAVSRSVAFESLKIRQMRSADISAGPQLQVLNLVIFPRPHYDLPYFCADLVTFPRGHLIVIDLNPVFTSPGYFEKFIRPAMPLVEKYAEPLPWGGEFTAEALQFFSPAMIWSRLPLSADVHGAVFDAFKDYLEVWLQMLEAAQPETNPEKVAAVMEAQHRYMSWRCEKDPGRPVLTKLFGAERCERYIHDFLFAGIQELGSKSFLEHFPEFRAPDGSIKKSRSMSGRSYATRPWDMNGNLTA